MPNKAASDLGKMGKGKSSPAKQASSRENLKKANQARLDARSSHVKKLYDTGRIKPSAPDELDMTPPKTTPDEYSQEMPDYEAGS